MMNEFKIIANKKFLVVDDAPENTFIFEMYLSEAGADVVLAHSGEEALKLCQQHTFSLILIDLEMPEMNGYQLIKEIKSLGIQTPLIALTAHASDAEKQKCKVAGFYKHIAKPIGAIEFLKSISEALSS